MFVSSSRFISFLYANISRREAYVRPLHTCTSQDLSLHPRSLVRNKRTRDSNTLTISVANSNISLIASSMYIPLPFLFPSSPFPFPSPLPLSHSISGRRPRARWWGRPVRRTRGGGPYPLAPKRGRTAEARTIYAHETHHLCAGADAWRSEATWSQGWDQRRATFQIRKEWRVCTCICNGFCIVFLYCFILYLVFITLFVKQSQQ